MEIYDISQTLRAGMPVWPGDPQFRSHRVLQMRNGSPSNVSAFEMGTHTGTHIDVPFHLDSTGRDTADIPIHHFIGPVRVFSLAVRQCIRSTDLSGLDWHGVQRALFRTYQCEPAGTTFKKDFVYFEEDAAEFLAGLRILLVGTDAPSVDAFDSTALPSHRTLLGRDVMILENVRLGNVPPGDYDLICLPLKLSGMDGSPVRAILRK